MVVIISVGVDIAEKDLSKFGLSGVGHRNVDREVASAVHPEHRGENDRGGCPAVLHCVRAHPGGTVNMKRLMVDLAVDHAGAVQKR